MLKYISELAFTSPYYFFILRFSFFGLVEHFISSKEKNEDVGNTLELLTVKIFMK